MGGSFQVRNFSQIKPPVLGRKKEKTCPRVIVVARILLTRDQPISAERSSLGDQSERSIVTLLELRLSLRAISRTEKNKGIFELKF